MTDTSTVGAGSIVQGTNFLASVSQNASPNLQLVISTLQNLVIATNTISINLTAALANLANLSG